MRARVPFDDMMSAPAREMNLMTFERVSECPTVSQLPRICGVIIAALGMSTLATAQDETAAEAPEVAKFTVREGYTVDVAVDGLKGARFMEFDAAGRLYISRPRVGDVIVLTDTDGNGYYEDRATFVTGLQSVHGLCFHKGWMYFTTSGTIQKARDTDGDGKADDIEVVVGEDKQPSGGTHWWRSILVTDDAIYTSIGDSGNITDESTTDRQKIWKWNHSGTEKTMFASGVRNTEKLRLRPGTTEIWGVDHGSDMFGTQFGETDSSPITDHNPPCEFNKYVEGGFYGHPFLVGNRVPRQEFKERTDLVVFAEYTRVPEWCFGAHWAPNGFCFIDPALNARTGALPADASGDAFVAFHGSWNSSVRVGYQVARVLFDKDAKLGGSPKGLETIVSTRTPDGAEVFGRPVDCVQAPDGSVLWSDDLTGKVYRVRAAKPAAKAVVPAAAP